jgi:NAD(P)-dependent dehydrogenase (short-subunit alcohol dehydrogenase family)
VELNLENKVVVVTGAAGGVGAAVARAFCAEKSRVVFVDRAPGGTGALEGYEDRGCFMRCDVSDPGRVTSLFEEVGERFGCMHVLVNNAAVGTAGYVEDIREQDLQRVIDVNIRGYVHTTMRAVPLMRRAGFGRLIYINSSSGLKASAGLSLYSGSKYFDRGFAVAVALEVGKHNITANSICPSDIYPEGDDPRTRAGSWTKESLVRVSLDKEGVSSLEELMAKRRGKNPMRRSCTVRDVADMALFLASERAGFINGQSIGVNGGAVPY